MLIVYSLVWLVARNSGIKWLRTLQVPLHHGYGPRLDSLLFGVDHLCSECSPWEVADHLPPPPLLAIYKITSIRLVLEIAVGVVQLPWDTLHPFIGLAVRFFIHSWHVGIVCIVCSQAVIVSKAVASNSACSSPLHAHDDWLLPVTRPGNRRSY